MPSSNQRAREAGALYDALMLLDGGTSAALAESVNRPEPAVVQLLDELVGAGFVWSDAGPPITYHRAHRTAGVVALAARRRAELADLSDRLELDLGVLDVLMARTEASGGWQPRVERISDLPSIRARLAELQRTSSVELLSFDFGSMSRARKTLREEAYAASAKLDREWLARGGSMRTIFAEAVQYDSLAWAFTRRPISEGGLVRLSPALPMQLLIVDREVAIVQVDPKDSSAGALFISEPGIVSALVDLFEVYWLHASEIDSPAGKDVNDLTPQQRAVLGLLELGHKDESIARHLGVSLRTANRVIAETLAGLGAESRFQAGVLAAKRGWLTPRQSAEGQEPDAQEAEAQ